MAPKLIDGVWWTDLGVRLPATFIPHWPHGPQEAFLATDADEALFGGAARGGKTDGMLMAALMYADVPGYSAVILRRESPELYGADGFIERALEWLAPVIGRDAWNSTRLTWTFPSGATLRFGHMQREDDKIDFQGQRFQFVGFDELTHFTETQYRYLFSRLDRPADGILSEIPLRMRSTSNPGGPGHDWVKRRFIDRQTDPDDIEDTPEKAAARVFISARVVDNPSVDRDAYIRQLSYLEPEVRAQLLDGDWDAREPGDWYFDDSHLTAAIAQGREYEALLMRDEMFLPHGGVLHLGLDWGTSSHSLLGWPLSTGGFLIVREYVGYREEVTDKTPRILALNEWDIPWGKAHFDAAGHDAQLTFNRTAGILLGGRRPPALKVSFGAKAPSTTLTAKKSLKGIGCAYLRRLARRAHGVYVRDWMEVPARTEGSVFIPGPLPGHLAISPACPELIRQLKRIEADPENPTDAWLKDDDQHGPDAAIALVVPTALRFRAPPKTPIAA